MVTRTQIEYFLTGGGDDTYATRNGWCVLAVSIRILKINEYMLKWVNLAKNDSESLIGS
jgi:hypothetical protein